MLMISLVLGDLSDVGKRSSKHVAVSGSWTKDPCILPFDMANSLLARSHAIQPVPDDRGL